MAKIVFFENIHPSARAVFARAGLTDITTYNSALSPEALIEAVRGAEVLGIRSRTQMDRAALAAAAPSLRTVGCFCIGTNQVDLKGAAEQGVPVFNAPFSNTRSVAELVIAEAILLLRRVPEKSDRVHHGHWDKTATGAYEARGKTLGIIGYGNIGSQVGTLAESIGMRVIFHDLEAKLPLGNARAQPDLSVLLGEADVLTLHVPGGRGTENIINADTLKQMKPGSILINASRGGVVDIDALRDALVSKHIAGAALDVFPVEPKSVDEPLASPLIGLPNVILTPHIGGSTMESQENIGIEVAEKLVRFIQTGTTKGAVNFPELSYEDAEGAARLLHVHRNEPGVLASLNNLLAERKLNIVSQRLHTKGGIGYVITDVDGNIDAGALEAVRKQSSTIRADVV
ncbi:phosphoglycerate dehydrogenase [Pigmentiphaga aceris]|uniref:D-3-phosphoglycerate dehydrogenase n=1 Tax=Pigmentiphaga aceris TaxID=1940612 RepID=A0A5C0B6T0_9BURK|nr:phosphoglycerate dehydrogenase [Pigmentiphaga aceris]QEI08671.1 phosphoglycerate dehydrogenase [Pigmentiphaga aceris]